MLRFSSTAHAIEALLATVDIQADAIVVGDDPLQRHPPQFADPVGKSGRDIKRERHVVLLQDRPGILQEVAIAVVEGDADEAALEIALHQAAIHLVERDDVEVGTLQAPDHGRKKARRHLEQTVRLEGAAPGGPHVMQRQDRAYALKKRTQGHMGAAEIQGFKPCPDDCLLEAAHVRTHFFRKARSSNPSANPLLRILCHVAGFQGGFGRHEFRACKTTEHGRSLPSGAALRHPAPAGPYRDCRQISRTPKSRGDGCSSRTASPHAYQNFDFCALWFEHVGAPAGIQPFIVIGRDAAGLPAISVAAGHFEIRAVPGRDAFSAAAMPISAPPVAQRHRCRALPLPNLRAILDRAPRSRHRHARAANQPMQWHGIANPLMLLPHQASPDESYQSDA